jgi:hypothetical protein
MSQAEANGRLRLLRAGIFISAARTRRVLDGHALDGDIESLVRRGSERGRQRAATRLRSSLPAVFEWRPVRGGLLGAYLDAVQNPIIQTPIDIGQTQPSVIVAYLVLGTDGILTATGLWTLEVPDHALRRAIERDPRGDVRAKVQEAHGRLLQTSGDEPPTIGEEFLIPTSGPGVFVAEWIVGTLKHCGNVMLYARARTWLHDDQISDRQTQQVPPSAPSGKRTLLDIGILTPVALRTSSVVS